jgi:hypothetical protein
VVEGSRKRGILEGDYPRPEHGFASGCWHASWVVLCYVVEDAAHNVVDQVIGFVPMSEVEIEDTWFVAGMRGTGSNTLVAKAGPKRPADSDHPAQGVTLLK